MPRSVATLLLLVCLPALAASQPAMTAAATGPRRPGEVAALTAANCTPGRLGRAIGVAKIGEPVAAVTLSAPRWTPATETSGAFCSVEGAIAPLDKKPTAREINFRVLLPASWTGRTAQLGGAGMNGVIPNLTGPSSPLERGFVVFGSDSGHQMAAGPRGSAPGPPPDWVLNDEAMKNLGYMQMKKTRDAVMVIVQRAYERRPRFNYYIGTSQGGREALTVAQRYPADYDGIIANVPIVSFSSLMLAPELIRIQEKPAANWVTPAKTEAIRAEFVRQCDALDGLADGIINNYMACRAIFDVTQGAKDRHPWAARRCPDGVDPNPGDTTAGACLTDGQIATLEFVYRRYPFATPLAHGVTSFGMWVPNTDPSGSGLIVGVRFAGQEGAEENAPVHGHLGVLGVTGFLMRDLGANPLDYVEGGPVNDRRVEISKYLDATNPDLSAFARRGGKAIVTIGTNDTLASPGAQLDYFQSVIGRMGRASVDRFARFFVMPQTGHGLTGTNYVQDGNGNTIPVAPIPNAFDRFALLTAWVEEGVAPGMSVTVTAGGKSLPLCSYPAYPRYVSGPPESASSYACRAD